MGQERLVCHPELRRVACGLERQRSGMQLTWRQESKCLLGHPETMGHREDSDRRGLARVLPVTHSLY